jgi:hypothetical protein
MPKRTGKHLDVVQNAKRIMDEALSHVESPGPVAVNDAMISEVMREMGRRGGKVGGRSRMDSMTKKQRSAFGRAAVKARWEKYRAEHTKKHA